LPLVPIRKREFPLYYAKGKRLFQIIVHISDAPGSLGATLNLLGPMVNMVGTSTYTLGDGTAMISAFAEGLGPEVTSGTIQRALGGSKATIESEVREGHEGLLVDSFHTGLKVGGDDYILLRRGGMISVFDQIVKIFGTGGEVLLYEEGKALGRGNAQKRVDELGSDTVVKDAGYLAKALSAQGWGKVETTSKPGSKEFVVTVTDCFECTGSARVRKRCDFVRGFFEGSSGVTRGVPIRVEEVECTLRGDPACSFRISLSR
jgi:predicted hydrocarbon binding protein